MSGCFIRPRTTTSGERRYQVLYRRGGRAYKLEAAGTFKTKREAETRRDVVRGWLAAGLNPKVEIAKLRAIESTTQITVREAARRYSSSRIDYADETQKNLRSHLKRLYEAPFADKAADEVTAGDIQELVAEWSKVLKPASLRRYIATVRLVFDHAGVDPNPARDERVKLPQIVRQEARPPTADEFVRMLEAMPRRYWLPLVVIEQTGMRVGEAASLTWGDVDERSCRFRLRAGETKTRRARWVQLPAWLMAIVSYTVAREDRLPDRRVFAGFSGDVAKNAMARGCRTAGLPVFSPHDLRHRRGTIWHQDPSVTIREQMERGGWTRSDIAIDTYSHLLPLDEVPIERLKGLLVMTR